MHECTECGYYCDCDDENDDLPQPEHCVHREYPDLCEYYLATDK